ncbi:MAG: signal recognition particle-docking protein FtsY [Bacillota bacterium]
MPPVWERLRRGMRKTRDSLVASIDALVRRHGVSSQLYEALEESLIAADVGPAMAARVVEALRTRQKGAHDAVSLRQALADVMAEELARGQAHLAWDLPNPPRPQAALVVGVNGSGKTTTAGKLAWRLRQEGRRVLLVAADTFRAAAQEQLALWADRAGADLVRGSPGQDPASVAFDGVQAAKARSSDALIIDTAGRLHNKSQLMAELAKIRRVTEKGLGRAPDEVLLVLDATTGQNGLVQARIFTEAVAVTGIVLTKLDGTARGGIAFTIAAELGLPLKLVGVGEDPEDLRPFDPRQFAAAILDTAPDQG